MLKNIFKKTQKVSCSKCSSTYGQQYWRRHLGWLFECNHCGHNTAFNKAN